MKELKVSLVTGASRGIGKAIAMALAEQNHKLAIFGRDENALDKTKVEVTSAGSECMSFLGDVRDVEFVNKSVNSVIKTFGHIDNLINNAGYGTFKKFTDSTLEEFKDQMDVNLFGVYNFTKAVVPGMIQQVGGNIINISSLAGKNSFVGGTMYSSSKFALMGFSRSLMLELREYFIRVILICPGTVDTEFFIHSGNNQPDSKKVLKAVDVADAVMAAINLPSGAMISEIDIRPTKPK